MPANCSCRGIISLALCLYKNRGCVCRTYIVMHAHDPTCFMQIFKCVGLAFYKLQLSPFFLFWCVGASALLGKRCFAAKLTFTGVCPPPVILSTPSLCGAQPSKTSDRQANGSGGLQQHNTLSLPSLCPAVGFNAHTYTHKRKKGHIL